MSLRTSTGRRPTAAAALACCVTLIVAACDTSAAAADLEETAAVSYAIDTQIGSSLLRQPIEVDVDEVVHGLRDALVGRSEVSDADVVRILQSYAYLRDEAVENNRAGHAFREQHAQQEGVVRLPSGVQYQILATGTGVQPRASDTALSWYVIDNIRGRRLASRLRADDDPASLSLEGLIPGLREALLVMREGDRWRTVLPPEVAFDDASLGSEIGPNETIVVELQLVAVMQGATVVE